MEVLHSFEEVNIEYFDRLELQVSDDGVQAAYSTEGRTVETAGDLAILNLGSAPNTTVLRNVLGLTPSQYPSIISSSGIVCVGDVAHSSHQRVSVAIGEGAAAILNYYYAREGVHSYST